MPFGVAHRLSSCPGLLVGIKPHGSFGLSTALRRSARCPRTDSKPPDTKASSTVQMTEETLRLEPLSDKIIGYFAERKISEETLERDGVKQLSGKESVISFPYKREGQLVGCKYWTLDKKFWQEKGTKKTLYGLDDISEADEIVIVEGEIDKLSLEEAGFRNCASVPSGAPGNVSKKGLPSPDKTERSKRTFEEAEPSLFNIFQNWLEANEHNPKWCLTLGFIPLHQEGWGEIPPNHLQSLFGNGLCLNATLTNRISLAIARDLVSQLS